MTDLFFSSEAKYRNAAYHLAAFESELGEYGKRHVPGTVPKTNLDRTKWSWHLRLKEPPDLDWWGTRIGDCLFNLRSCLDNAIYGLAIAKSNTDPPPGERVLAFPIGHCPDNFTSQLWRLDKLRGVPGLVTKIEDLQPYRRPNPTYAPALLLLRDLNDRDKHRVVHIVAGSLSSGNVKYTCVPTDAQIVDEEHFTTGPFEDGTLIYSLTFDRPMASVQMISSTAELVASLEVEDATRSLRAIGASEVLDYIRTETRFCLDKIKALV
jgi:hypothetical protein